MNPEKRIVEIFEKYNENPEELAKVIGVIYLGVQMKVKENETDKCDSYTLFDHFLEGVKKGFENSKITKEEIRELLEDVKINWLGLEMRGDEYVERRFSQIEKRVKEKRREALDAFHREEGIPSYHSPKGEKE